MTKREAGYAKMLEADTARIVRFPSKMFLVLGWRRHTKDRKGSYWVKSVKGKSERIDFPYLEERAVASGATFTELRKSAVKYRRLMKLEKLKSKLDPGECFKRLFEALGV